MPTIAELIMKANTRELEKAEGVLGKVTVAGTKAEKATDGVSKGFDGVAANTNKAIKPLNASALAMNSVGKFAVAAAAGLAGLVAGYVGMQAAGAGIAAARGFNAAIAETSTLIAGTPAELDELSASARALAVAYGGDAESQVRAFYQAISAGAGGVTEATALLDQANKLAIGGATDVTTAVDALTTAVNAYGPEVLTAAMASDSMFVAMRAGKTTIGELSANLGQIVPIASAAGVSFDEVTGGIAALTTQGLSTSAATTGLRQVLASVIAPTKQATDAAAALGLSFDVQSLKAKGLEGFLNEVVTATGGSEAAMAQLFGSVEALGAVLAFAGGAGDKFSQIMVDQADKAGATDAAYQKMAESLDRRWSNATAAASNLALGFGNVLLTVVVPAMELMAAGGILLADNLDVIGIAILALTATRLPALILSMRAATAGMTLMQAQFIAGAVAARGMAVAARVATGALALLGGPLGIAVGLAAAAGGAFLLFRDNADTVKKPTDEAAEANRLLAEAMAQVVGGEPAASAAVIALANNNVKLASSAYEAAKAELVKRRAIIESARATSASALDPEAALLLGEKEAAAQRAYNRALAETAEAERRLRDAIVDRKMNTDSIAPSIAQVTANTNAGADAAEAARLRAEELLKAMAGLGGSAKGAKKDLIDASDAIRAAEDALKAAEDQTKRTADGFASMARSMIFDGGNISDMLKNLGGTLFESGLSGLFQSAISSGGGGFLASVGSFLFPSANGNVFSGGNVVPFARGGVVSSPTTFPMRSGQTGLMGEAGPEAIMPLTRIGGKLGVRADGGGGTATLRIIAPEGFEVDFDGKMTGIAVEVTKAGIQQFAKHSMPGLVQQINKDPKRRG